MILEVTKILLRIIDLMELFLPKNFIMDLIYHIGLGAMILTPELVLLISHINRRE